VTGTRAGSGERQADVVVVSGGGPPDPEAAGAVPGDAYVVAADSGLDHARALGLAVDLVVGDMDSVSAGSLEAAMAAGAVVERHPEAKDATDLELALDAAAVRGAARILVLGPDGGRLDHTLSTAALLASPRYAGIDVQARLGLAHLVVVRSAATLTGRPGRLVTLLPMHGPARGVTTDGLLYPLRDEDLDPGSTRGVSNEMVGTTATVTVRGGVLVALLPGPAGTHWRRGVAPAP
jgi:thiamine pyrophosphokinase